MHFSGFADEAASDIAGQIKATKELGWRCIESRAIEGKNIHDIDDAAFDRVAGALKDADVDIDCFGSAICNWGKKITEPFDSSLAEAKRAIPRMRRLGVRQVRIMSFAVLADKPPAEQMADERFRRLRQLVPMFLDAGIQPLHENCMNYGGMGASATLRLVQEVPGLKLVYDTGNPLHSVDWDAPPGPDGKRPHQSSWAFYKAVRPHIQRVHIKDSAPDAKGELQHCWPGAGIGDTRRIIEDLIATGYDGPLSIEPHMAVQAHDPSITSPDAIRYANYVEYGRRFAKLFADAQAAAKMRGRAG